ncbi:MAG: hypothetical protein KKC23_03335, partial [Proteobacteria bacterium]|nr:hypothetical protein [Pseudomonadota bacterium]
MMRELPILKTLVFEIRYSSGHLYYDRCGQTLQDIENNLVGWVGGIPDINTGSLQRIDKEYNASFGGIKYDFTANNAGKEETEIIAKDISSLWRIIQANLGMEDFVRVGCRFYYLIPTESTEEAEDRLKASELTIKFPESFFQNDNKIKNRHIITVITNG